MATTCIMAGTGTRSTGATRRLVLVQGIEGEKQMMVKTEIESRELRERGKSTNMAESSPGNSIGNTIESSLGNSMCSAGF